MLPEVSPAVSGERFAVIAGEGDLPKNVCRFAKKAGFHVTAICHKGCSDTELAEIADECFWIKFGEIGKIASIIQQTGTDCLTFAGGVSRVSLFRDVKLDSYGIRIMLRARSAKDDILLRECAREIENLGVKVLPVAAFTPKSITKPGGAKLSAAEKEDIHVGVSCLKALSSEHVGQTVVVKDGVVVAVEAVEGTDQAIRRGGELAHKGAVVVKCAKNNQDMRFDVPTVGLRTIEVMKQSRCSLLALEAGRSVILEPEKFYKEAKRAGIKVVGISVADYAG